MSFLRRCGEFKLEAEIELELERDVPARRRERLTQTSKYSPDETREAGETDYREGGGGKNFPFAFAFLLLASASGFYIE